MAERKGAKGVRGSKGLESEPKPLPTQVKTKGPPPEPEERPEPGPGPLKRTQSASVPVPEPKRRDRHESGGGQSPVFRAPIPAWKTPLGEMSPRPLESPGSSIILWGPPSSQAITTESSTGEEGKSTQPQSSSASRYAGSEALEDSPENSERPADYFTTEGTHRDKVNFGFIVRADSPGPEVLKFYDELGVKVDKPLAQSYVREIHIKDWIDNHDFLEAKVKDSMELVDWNQLLPHEKLLAYNHAKYRALSAHREYLYQFEEARKKAEKEASKKESKKAKKEDEEQPKTLGDLPLEPGDRWPNPTDCLDLNDLPEIHEPELVDEPKLFRTVVVLATVYHGLSTKSYNGVKIAAEKSLFSIWLGQTGEPGSMKSLLERANDLRVLRLSDDVLKSEAKNLRKAIHNARAKYNSLSSKPGPGIGHWTNVQELVGNKILNNLSKHNLSLWTTEEENIDKWNLNEITDHVQKDSDDGPIMDDEYPSEPEEGEEVTEAEHFRRGLAHAVASLVCLRKLIGDLQAKVPKESGSTSKGKEKQKQTESSAEPEKAPKQSHAKSEVKKTEKKTTEPEQQKKSSGCKR